MKAVPPLHAWDLTPAQAIQVQTDLRGRLLLSGVPDPVRRIAGSDIALWPEEGRGVAGVIVYEVSYELDGRLQLIEIERTWAAGPLPFPYIPGLLSFREIPLLLQAYEKVQSEPDLILVDGHGQAHPRRMGIASHLGLMLDKPTIGCGKSRLTGTFEPPANVFGAVSPLRDRQEVIGAVVRTKTNVSPIFVSAGHRIDQANAVKWALACCDGFRVPRPTREADRYVAALKKEVRYNTLSL